MRKAKVFVSDTEAGTLTELEFGKKYCFEYLTGYSGTPVSLTMLVSQSVYEYDSFPSFLYATTCIDKMVFKYICRHYYNCFYDIACSTYGIYTTKRS